MDPLAQACCKPGVPSGRASAPASTASRTGRAPAVLVERSQASLEQVAPGERGEATQHGAGR
eukprot:scaffold7340_cov266-Pinguiococcus_pyrenoidosus.AAC.89